MDSHVQSVGVALTPQFIFFHLTTVKEGCSASGAGCLCPNPVQYSVKDKRVIRVEVVGNFLCGPEFYGNWLVSA
jgi:hypothetical protein